MSEQKPRVAVVGEMLIELAREADGRFRLGYVGDTFNVAVYLARGGIETAFVTALGEDPYSDAVIALATAEGIAGDLMLRICGRVPGLAVLETDASGARHPANGAAKRLCGTSSSCRIGGASPKVWPRRSSVFLRHHPLALFQCRARPFPRDPRSDPSQGRENRVRRKFPATRLARGPLSRGTVFIEALKRVDIALPTYDDEAVLWGVPSPEATVARLQAFGIAEIVVKNGPSSALLAAGGKTELIPVPEVVVPVDSTAAGDGFNAAYIAARLAGERPAQAAGAAHRLAGQVIRHRGALMPRTAVAIH